MKVAIIGGTGRMGRALARQLSKKNRVLIGSRDPARARKAAEEVGGAEGLGYAGASREADAAVLVVPYSGIGEVAALSEPLAGKLVATAVNPLKMEEGRLAYALATGSAAEELARLLPRSHLATAFNHVSSLFFEREVIVPIDILVAADSRETYEDAARLVKSVPNLRPLYAGPLSEARTVEMMTPMVLNLAKLNGTGSLTTRFASTRDGPR